MTDVPDAARMAMAQTATAALRYDPGHPWTTRLAKAMAMESDLNAPSPTRNADPAGDAPAPDISGLRAATDGAGQQA